MQACLGATHKGLSLLPFSPLPLSPLPLSSLLLSPLPHPFSFAASASLSPLLQPLLVPFSVALHLSPYGSLERWPPRPLWSFCPPGRAIRRFRLQILRLFSSVSSYSASFHFPPPSPRRSHLQSHHPSRRSARPLSPPRHRSRPRAAPASSCVLQQVAARRRLLSPGPGPLLPRSLLHRFVSPCGSFEVWPMYTCFVYSTGSL